MNFRCIIPATMLLTSALVPILALTAIVISRLIAAMHLCVFQRIIMSAATANDERIVTMKMKRELLLVAAALVLCATHLPAAEPVNPERAARLAWWHEAKFGMFIHWGLYSQLAG